MVSINSAGYGGGVPIKQLNTTKDIKINPKINFNSAQPSADVDSAPIVDTLSTQAAPTPEKKEQTKSSDFEKEFLKQCANHFGFMTVMGR